MLEYSSGFRLFQRSNSIASAGWIEGDPDHSGPVAGGRKLNRAGYAANRPSFKLGVDYQYRVTNYPGLPAESDKRLNRSGVYTI